MVVLYVRGGNVVQPKVLAITRYLTCNKAAKHKGPPESFLHRICKGTQKVP